MTKTRNLIGIQPLVDMIALALQSSYIANERNGISLIIVANAESAKTTTAFEFSNLEHVAYYDDITQKKLIEEFIPMVRTNIKKTLVIPDLINCIEKQKVTRNGFLNIIKSGIDDTGLNAISTPNLLLQRAIARDSSISGTRFNMITGITKDSFMNGDIATLSMRKTMIRTGLLSRFLPFSYEYDAMLVQKIFDFQNGKQLDDKDFCDVPQISNEFTAVELDYQFARELDTFAVLLNSEFDKSGYGIRPHQNLIRLAKSNALLNKRNVVNQSDIVKVMQLSRYMNFKFNGLS